MQIQLDKEILSKCVKWHQISIKQNLYLSLLRDNHQFQGQMCLVSNILI